MRERFIQFFCVCIFLTLISFYAAGQHTIKGQADLSKHNFASKAANLSGSWEFYWNELLTPGDFTKKPTPSFVNVPGSWHRQGNYSVLGCATYRVVITLSEDQRNLSLYLPVINASAKVWVNGNLVEETGKVSCNAKEYKAKLVGTMVALPSDAAQVEVIVQVANHSYFSAGIGAVPVVDKATALYAAMNRTNGLENFFTGSLIAMFIYQLILYFLYDRGKPYLYLGLICLGVALRAMIVHGGSFLLPNLYPSVDWEYWKKIEFGCVYAIISLFPLYVYYLFPAHAPRKPIQFFVIVSIVLCVTVLATPQHVYGKLLDVAHLALLLAFIYAVYTIGSAWRGGNNDAKIIMLGVVASFPFILAEILKNTRFLPVEIGFMYLVELGVLVFLLFQVYLLANHYAKAYRNLEHLNQNLEKIVAERSGELITANTVKDKLLSVVSHDIKSPLNSLRSVLHVYNKGAINKEEFDTFTKHLEDDLGKTSMLVENLLYWTASQLKGVEVRNEMFELYGLVEENIQLFNTIAANKKIAIKHEIQRGVMVNTDRNILNLVLRNVISNAIKFSFEGSVIKINGGVAHGILKLEVEDSGVGMDQSTIDKLFTPDLTVSSKGTSNEKGTGLGLALCHDYIVKAGGQLIVESTKGEGSRFIIILLQDNDRIDVSD